MALATVSPKDSPDGQPDSEGGITTMTRFLTGPIDIRSLALSGLFLLACLYTLYFARNLLFPIALATVLSLLLSPLINLLEKLKVSRYLGAGLVVISLVLLVLVSLYRLTVPAGEWIKKAPAAMNRIETKLQHVRQSFRHMTQATEALEEITSMPDRANGSGATVKITEAGWGTAVFEMTTEFMVVSVATLVLMFFLLSSGDFFLEKLVKVLPTLSDKKRAVEIVRGVEENISGYLFTVTLINLGLGCCVGFVMYALGMPNPVLWGVMAGVFNFIPYIGGLVGMGILTMAAALTFDHLFAIVLPVLAYGCLTVLEGMVFTPMILGRRFLLNPVVVLLGIMFWGWIWGVGGALLAVPIVASIKIVCDHLEPLAPFGEFLGP